MLLASEASSKVALFHPLTDRFFTDIHVKASLYKQIPPMYYTSVVTVIIDKFFENIEICFYKLSCTAARFREGVGEGTLVFFFNNPPARSFRDAITAKNIVIKKRNAFYFY